MRSRYSAFAIGDAAYLLATWHADFRPAGLELDPRIRWTGLEILVCEQQVQQATVEFEATLLLSGTVSTLHERSEFVCQQGRWLYTRGEQLAPSIMPWKPGRNQPCPCGSGLKFKRCCAWPAQSAQRDARFRRYAD
jgi:SEC-C motif-containing protein